MNKSLAKRASAWVAAAFGIENATNRKERACRFVEEAIELAQAEGVDPMRILKISERVFSRPVGDPMQEAGGAGLCLLAWGEAAGVDLEVLIEREIVRVESGDIDAFRKKHADKIAAGTAEK